MKRALSFLLLLGICLSLCGCSQPAIPTGETISNETISKEEMASNAKSIRWNKILEDYEANPVRAASIHEGQIYKYTGTVDDFLSGNRISIRPSGTADLFSIVVTLSEGEILEISKGDTVEVIGVVEKLSQQYNTTAGVGIYMKDAYIISK